MANQVRNLCFGGRRFRVISQFGTAHSNTVLRVIDPDAGQLRVLKMFTARKRAFKEANLLVALRSRGVLCPQVYQTDAVVTRGHQYTGILMEHVQGVPIRRLSGVRAYGQALGVLWSVDTEGLDLESRDVGSLSAAVTTLEATLGPDQRRMVASLQEDLTEDCAGSRVALHGDPGPDNVLLTQDGPCLLDFERAGYGLAGLDVARAAITFSLRAAVHPLAIRQHLLGQMPISATAQTWRHCWAVGAAELMLWRWNHQGESDVRPWEEVAGVWARGRDA